MKSCPYSQDRVSRVMTCLITCSGEESEESGERTCFGLFQQTKECSVTCRVKEKTRKRKRSFFIMIIANIRKCFRK